MTRFFLVILILIPHWVLAQFTYVTDQSIPVKDLNSNELTMPWGGGLNATQYNTMDLNNDGKDDLVLFDRMANKVITYLRQNDQYRYAPEYELLFPEDVTNWLLLRDHNCDGKKDIFTGDVLGMKVYTNTTMPGQNLSWKQVLFYSGFPGPKSQVLLTKGFSGKINLQLQFDDLPSISDVDGDGDLDIFNMRFVGNGTVEFHKNFSTERYGSCDSLDFERITQNWGNFKECSCGKFAFNGDDCPAGGRVKHAGGKSLLAIDVNNDLQPELIFSEASCTTLYLLENQGTILNPIVNSSSVFPSSHPVSFIQFPAAFYEDVDADGKKDLISSPNIYTKTSLSSDLRNSNWLYKNTGTTANPIFSFTQENFLQENMIDVGDNAVPAFADADGDGDYDMFISRNAADNFISDISFYENTGGAKTPAFKLVTVDYQNLSSFFYYNIKIQFADMDANNTLDLVFTGTSLQNGNTKLFFISNKSQNILDFSNPEVIPIDFNLTFNENLCVTDVDSDGRMDILAGRSDGSLEYWRNTTQPPAYTFALQNNDFLSLGTSVLRQNIACSVADLDADGNADLAYGDQTGKLKIISNFRNAAVSDATTDIIFNNLLNRYAEQNLGGRIWPAIVNLFNSDKPAIAVGNILGGIQILRHDEGKSLPDNPVIDIYPNPLEQSEKLNVKIDRNASLQLISTLGQQLSDPVRLQANQIYEYKLPALAPGVYLLKFSLNKKSFTRRLAIY